jgi:hypothetical protein
MRGLDPIEYQYTSECRYDERLKTETERSIVRGTGKPKDRDEVNRREVYECDG